MGLIDFVRDAGAKVGIGKSSDERAAEAAEKERNEEGIKSLELEKHVKGFGLDIDGLDIRYDDGTATVRGKVADRSTKEKVVLAAGNVEGVDKVNDLIQVVREDTRDNAGLADAARRQMTASKAQADAESKYVTVKSGDTLSGIARDQYGDANKYPQIFEANKPMLKSADLIYPGQVLRIPPE